MKKIIRISLLCLIALMVVLPGCTAEEPGYIITTSDSEVMVVDSDGDIITIDEVTGAITTIEYEHHEIHEGCAFKSDINTEDLKNEGANNALHISFTTSNMARWTHLVVYGWASGAADLSIVEAPTGGVAGGSNLAVFNRDRNSSTASTMISTDDTAANQLTQDATAPTGGTEIHHWKLGAGKNKIGGDNRGNEEFILRQNTKYSLRMTSAVAVTRAQLTLEWYEHTNRR